ncbi:hypothetical protein [Kyrpidia tusciae]|uniref:hypothetical protein n=1 Tax=Kyrpidia tusciae TaxID=33943 RepID=UPI00059D75A2|nr:hypothetical protein [Kyrpidia tusciae]
MPLSDHVCDLPAVGDKLSVTVENCQTGNSAQFHRHLSLFVSVPAENPKSSDTNRSVLTVAAETVSESEQVPAQPIIDPLRDLLNRLSIF